MTLGTADIASVCILTLLLLAICLGVASVLVMVAGEVAQRVWYWSALRKRLRVQVKQWAPDLRCPR